MSMATDLAKFAEDNGVKYFMISFTDLFGGQRAKLVPARAIADMQEDGAGFAGFATWLDMTPAHPDMLAVPDPEAVIILPWNKEIAWVPGNCVMEGQDVAQAPRNVLRKLIVEAAAKGMHVKWMSCVSSPWNMYLETCILSIYNRSRLCHIQSS